MSQVDSGIISVFAFLDDYAPKVLQERKLRAIIKVICKVQEKPLTGLFSFLPLLLTRSISQY